MAQKVVADAREVAALVEKLVSDIADSEQGTEGLALVGIHKRGVPLAERLAQVLQDRLGTELELGSLDITLYRDDLASAPAQPQVHATQIEFDVSNRRIILVDDVLYTGRTARAALSEILDFGRPRRIELAVLIDRGHQELPIRADYFGKKIETATSQMVEVRLKETDGKDEVLLID
jgi:pyrimidine operon attenuation protein/uracil phosphoribosyltransferase